MNHKLCIGWNAHPHCEAWGTRWPWHGCRHRDGHQGPCECLCGTHRPTKSKAGRTR